MINKVILIGNLGKDPEIKLFANGNKVCNFSLATSESYKDKSGEWQTKTEWHNISVFNENLISLCEKYLKKGSKIYLEGKIESSKSKDEEGNEKTFYKIVLKSYNHSIKILDKQEKKEESDKQENQEFIENIQSGIVNNDDEIPF